MPSEISRFRSSRGATLAARVDRPDEAPRAWALLAHCFTCSKDLRSAGWLARALAARGMGCVRFDFTGFGESEGEFSGTDFSSNVEDVLAAAAFMRAELGAPRLLVGHSLGGAAVLAAAARVPEAELVVTIAAPSGTEHFRDKLVRMAPELEARGEAEVTLGGRRFRIRRQLLDDLAEHALEDAIASLGRALIVCHSPADTTVDITQGERIFALARHPKSFLCLEGADHLLLGDERDARLVAETAALWLARHGSSRA